MPVATFSQKLRKALHSALSAAATLNCVTRFTSVFLRASSAFCCFALSVARGADGAARGSPDRGFFATGRFEVWSQLAVAALGAEVATCADADWWRAWLSAPDGSFADDAEGAVSVPSIVSALRLAESSFWCLIWAIGMIRDTGNAGTGVGVDMSAFSRPGSKSVRYST